MLSQKEKELLGVRKAFQSVATDGLFRELHRLGLPGGTLRPRLRESLFWSVNDLCMKGLDESAADALHDLHMFGELSGTEPPHLLGVAARGGCLKTASDIMDRYDLSEVAVKGRILTAARGGHTPVALEMIRRFHFARVPDFIAQAARVASFNGHEGAARALNGACA